MKALVTGATGFLGMAICKRLLHNGYSLRCQYRTESKLRALQAYLEPVDRAVGNTDANVVDGTDLSAGGNTSFSAVTEGADRDTAGNDSVDDIEGGASSGKASDSNIASGNGVSAVEYVRQDLVTASQSIITSMVQGCSVVIHNAASVKDYGSSRAAYTVNVDTTERLLIAAIDCKIDRFVYISSIAVHGLKSAESITEDGPYNRLYNIYAKTKQKAEQAVQSIASQRSYRNYVIIRPGSIYGVGDHTTYYKIFEAIGNRQLPYAGTKHGVVPLIHKDDVAGAVLCALNPNPAICGHAYNIVSGERVEFKELFDFIASRLSVKPPSLVIPRAVGYAVCIVVMLVRKIPFVNFEPITLFRVRSMLSKRTFDTKKLKETLHFAPCRDWKSGFAECIAHYLQHKHSQ